MRAWPFLRRRARQLGDRVLREALAHAFDLAVLPFEERRPSAIHVSGIAVSRHPLVAA